MQQVSIYPKWSNKALPLQSRYLSAMWTAYTIPKDQIWRDYAV